MILIRMLKENILHYPTKNIYKINQLIFQERIYISIAHKPEKKLNVSNNGLRTPNKLHNNVFTAQNVTLANRNIIGQTKRNFEIRYGEHSADLKHNRRKSTCPTHLIDTGHELSHMFETFKILKRCLDNGLINLAEEYYITKQFLKDNCILNENLIHVRNPLYNL